MLHGAVIPKAKQRGAETAHRQYDVSLVDKPGQSYSIRLPGEFRGIAANVSPFSLSRCHVAVWSLSVGLHVSLTRRLYSRPPAPHLIPGDGPLILLHDVFQVVWPPRDNGPPAKTLRQATLKLPSSQTPSFTIRFRASMSCACRHADRAPSSPSSCPLHLRRPPFRQRRNVLHRRRRNENSKKLAYWNCGGVRSLGGRRRDADLPTSPRCGFLPILSRFGRARLNGGPAGLAERSVWRAEP